VNGYSLSTSGCAGGSPPCLQRWRWKQTIANDYGDIIKPMMRDLQEDDDSPNKAPRCEGCGQRVEIAPYQLRASNSSAEWVMYCVECRALATIVIGEE
jgi:hypothetical protein